MEQKYKLDDEREGARLEIQSSDKNYSLRQEFDVAKIKLSTGERILDAGCGTGLLSRFLIDNHPNQPLSVQAIDISENLLTFAQRETAKNIIYKGKISYEKKNIIDLDEHNKFNKIFSRYVFQHIPSRELQSTALRKLWNCLSPGGQIHITDCLGLFSHIDTTNVWLLEKIKQVESAIPIDMNIGPKLRGIALDVGVPADCVAVNVLPFRFESPAERLAEASIWRQRFENCKELLEEVLGELVAQRFSREYVKELTNPRTYLYAQKYIVSISRDR